MYINNIMLFILVVEMTLKHGSLCRQFDIYYYINRSRSCNSQKSNIILFYNTRCPISMVVFYRVSSLVIKACACVCP